MNTKTNFSEKPSVKTGLYIKGDFKKIISSECSINNTAVESNLNKEKTIVRDISQTPETNKSIKGNFTYTIQPGDNKRLSGDGVLRVYNIKEPIDIPVRNLLGKWKKSHIGVSLIIINGQWCVEGEVAAHSINKREKGVVVALKMMFRFAMS